MQRGPKKTTGAIVGLGNIGFGFGGDPKRKATWTHAQAFERSGSIELIAAVDTDAAKRAAFLAAYPKTRVFPSIEEMLNARVPELVSICAPTALHYLLARTCVKAGVQALFCEKPMAATQPQARAILELCRQARVVLAVNHIRRWDAHYLRMAGLIAKGGIGEVKSVSAYYSGQVFNIGTHLIDAIRMLTGLNPLQAVGFSPQPGAPDPHVSGLLIMDGGVPCALTCHGKREDLVFEIAVTGTRGRLRATDSPRTTRLEHFTASPNYAGYRELTSSAFAAPPKRDRFVKAVQDICAALKDRTREPACSGKDGYIALSAAESLSRSCREGSKPKEIK